VIAKRGEVKDWQKGKKEKKEKRKKKKEKS
jgi:hypothetical protein